MRAISKLYISFLFLLLIQCGLFAQTDREFWFVAPEVTSGHGNAPGGEPIYFRISSLTLPSNVVIEQPANPGFTPINVSLGANETQTIDMTPFVDFLENYPENSILNKGVHISASELITAYYEVAEEYNNDIFALKGKNALGTLFYAPMQNYFNNGNYTPKPYCRIDIVATEANTIVSFIPTADIVGHVAGSTVTITLNKGQTYSAVATSRDSCDHLGGTKIWVVNSTSSNPRKIAVTVSDDSMAANPHGGCRDINGDQIVPVDIIGKEYMFLATGAGLNVGMDRAFIIGTADNTLVTIHGYDTLILNESEIHQFEIVDPAYHVTTDKKVYCYHIGGQQGCEVGGAILPPIDKCTGSTQVGFTRSLDFPFSLVIMVRKNAEDAFILNGDGPNTIIDAASFISIPNSDWSYAVFPMSIAQIPVGVASLIRNTEDLFHLGVVNGNSGTGGMYGYFSDFNELVPSAFIAGVGSPYYRICFGATQQLIASGGTTYAWTPSSSLDDTTLATPFAFPDTTTRYNVIVSGACNLTDTLEVFLFVRDSINTVVAIDDPFGCSPHTVNLDLSASLGLKEYRYYWGDGTGDTLINNPYISHTYDYLGAVPDTFDIIVVGLNSGGCPDTAYERVVVYPKVTADFTIDTTMGCSPLTVNLHNYSINSSMYLWKFGDGASASDSLSLSHEYENRFNSTDTNYLLQLIAFSDYLCSDTTDTIVTVHPFIDASFVLSPAAYCSPYDANIINTTYYEGRALRDSLFLGDNTNLILNQWDTIQHQYSNPSATDTLYQITLISTDTLSGCSDAFIDSVIIYRPVDAIIDTVYTITGMASNDTIYGCHPLTIAFDGSQCINVTDYFWEFGDGSSSNDQNPVYSFENYDHTPKTFRVRLSATDRGNCFDVDSVYVTVYPYIRACFSFAPDENCSPYEVEFFNSSENISAINSYRWDFNGTIVVDNSYQDYYYHTFTNTPNVFFTHPPDSVYFIELMVFNQFGCWDRYIDSVRVLPEVIADFTPLPDNGCDSTIIIFDNRTLAGDYYDWDFGNGTSIEFEPQQIFTNPNPINSKSYIVTLSAADSSYRCSDTHSDTITIYPFTKARMTIPQSNVCAPDTINFVDISLGVGNVYINFGDGSDTTYVRSPSGAPINIFHIYDNQTNSIDTFYVRMNVWNAQCSDSIERRIVVYPRVYAEFSTNIDKGCNPLTVQFINNSAAIGISDSYFWNFDDGHSSNDSTASFNYTFYNFSHTQTDTFRVRLEVTSIDQCKATDDTLIIVYPKPKADFSTENDPACSPVDLIFNNDCLGTLASDTLFINFGDFTDTVIYAPTFNTINHFYYNNDTTFANYNVQWLLITEHNCSDTLNRNISIYPNIIADFNIDVSQGCTPLTVTFTNNSVGATAGVPYQWEYGDGATSSNANLIHSHEYNNFSTTADSVYHAVLTATSQFGCVATDDTLITVYLKPLADFDFSQNPICSPSIVDIINKSSSVVDSFYISFGPYAVPVDTMLYSNFASISQLFELNHSINQLVETDVTMIAYRGACSDTITRVLKIYPYIEALISTLNGVMSGCTPLTITFDGTQSINADLYEWDFDDNNTSSDSVTANKFFNSSYTTTQIFSVRLIVSSNQCADTTYMPISVFPKPYARFSIDTSESCAAYDLAFTNNSIPSNVNYYWNFDYYDVNPLVYSNDSLIPNLTFNNLYENLDTGNLNHDIRLIAVNSFGCQDTAFNRFIAYPHVVASFTSSVNIGCNPLSISFNNTSQRTQIWDWSFGDGFVSNSFSPGHTYYNPTGNQKLYEVELIARSIFNCRDTAYDSIIVLPMPEARFTAFPQIQTYTTIPPVVEFNDATIPNSTWFYQWSFGDGSAMSTMQNPTHTYPYPSPDLYTVKYPVTLTVSGYDNMCISTITDTVIIYSPPPRAAFGPSLIACPDHNNRLTVDFVDESLYGKYYLWDFGDGVIDSGLNLTNVSHTFKSDGYFWVTLKVYNAELIADTAKRLIVVHKLPIANFQVEPSYVELPEEIVKTINLSSLASEYMWDFNNDGIIESYEYEPVYLYDEAGVYDITLIVGTATEPVCYDTLTILKAVYADESCKLMFPNAFTPDKNGANGGAYFPEDPSNKIFHPISHGIIEYHLEIFNRWGELIFVSDDLMIGWDGYYKGELAKQDVYIWEVTAKCSNGKNIYQVGDVTLVR